MKQIAPYGTWTSPITAPDVASAESRFVFPAFAGDEVWWQEGRPDEGGRTTIMAGASGAGASGAGASGAGASGAGASGAGASGAAAPGTGASGAVRNLLPRPWNARNRVHEYGGVSFLPVPAASPVTGDDRASAAGAVSGADAVPGAGGVSGAGAASGTGGEGFDLVFANLADQRLYRIGAGHGAAEGATALTPGDAGFRFADMALSPDKSEIWCVREAHSGSGVSGENGSGSGAGGEASGESGANKGSVSGEAPSEGGASEGGASEGGDDGDGHGAGSGITRAIVAVPLDGSAADDPAKIRVMVTGADFFAFPTPSPDGTKLAWINWNHPLMPWDGTELRTGPATGGPASGGTASRGTASGGTPSGSTPSGSTLSGSTASASAVAGITVGESTLVMGGPGESVQAPEWRDDSELYAISDRSGWWNLYRVPESGGEPKALCPREEEFAGPLWQLGARPYAILGDGRLAVTHGTGEQRLSVLDPESGELTDTGLPYQAYGTIAASGMAIAAVAGSARTPLRMIRLDVARAGGAGASDAKADDAQPHDAKPGDAKASDAKAGNDNARDDKADAGRAGDAAAPVVLREARVAVDLAYLPVARQVALPAGPEGSAVHALVYPPSSPDYEAPEGELPPYIVWVHGGPTSKSMPVLDVEKAYFTSRGIGVIDVNYGGSTGYGRAYRERLRGQWGVVDVADAMNAALALAEAGEADGRRLGIRGGSAGGWTALAAVTSGLTGSSDDAAGHPPVFAAAVSYYGVAELKSFIETTHDFESRYLDGLIGPLPSASALYDERSPMGHVTPLTCPILLLQGLDDPIVPPSQAEAIAADLAAHGIRYGYIAFEGESHGFRKAESIVRSLEAELAFYGQIMGFTPPGVSPVTLEEPDPADRS